MPGWARLQYLNVSVRAVGGPIHIGPEHPPECERIGFGGRFLGELWAHFCGTTTPSSLQGELGMMTSQAPTRAGRRPGWARLLLAHVKARIEGRSFQEEPQHMLANMRSGLSRQTWGTPLLGHSSCYAEQWLGLGAGQARPGKARL